MARMLLAALLSAALFWATPTQATPVNNLEPKVVVAKPAGQVVSNTNHPAQEAKPVETPAPQQPEVQPEQATVETPAPIEQVSHPVGCENYRQLISQYDWNVDTFLQIASAESGCNPYAVGDNRVIGGIYAPSCGLFQVRTLASRPSCEELKDPATNIAWAYRIYQGQGHGAWSVCRTKVNCM